MILEDIIIFRKLGRNARVFALTKIAKDIKRDK